MTPKTTARAASDPPIPPPIAAVRFFEVGSVIKSVGLKSYFALQQYQNISDEMLS